MEFGSDHKPIIQYSNFALADVVNKKQFKRFCESIGHLAKEEQKKVRKKCQFLLDNDLRCIPLNEKIVHQAYQLLHYFMTDNDDVKKDFRNSWNEKKKKYNVKKDFRNSWNDMLILATALVYNLELNAKDTLLNSIAAEHYAPYSTHRGSFLCISFDKEEISMRQLSRESKGYINRSWKVRFYH
jgi:hypothetical protein